jgi:hypothetical protein
MVHPYQPFIIHYYPINHHELLLLLLLISIIHIKHHIQSLKTMNYYIMNH